MKYKLTILAALISTNVLAVNPCLKHPNSTTCFLSTGLTIAPWTPAQLAAYEKQGATKNAQTNAKTDAALVKLNNQLKKVDGNGDTANRTSTAAGNGPHSVTPYRIGQVYLSGGEYANYLNYSFQGLSGLYGPSGSGLDDIGSGFTSFGNDIAGIF